VIVSNALRFIFSIPRVHLGQTFVMLQNASDFRARQEAVYDKHLATIYYSTVNLNNVTTYQEPGSQSSPPCCSMYHAPVTKEHQPIRIIASRSTSISLCLLRPTCCLPHHLSVLVSSCGGTIIEPPVTHWNTHSPTWILFFFHLDISIRLGKLIL
jgi:hypothetical protein